MCGPQTLHLGLLRKQPLVASPACSTNASFTGPTRYPSFAWSRAKPPSRWRWRAAPAATTCGWIAAHAAIRIAHRRHHARRCEQVVVPRRELPVEVLPPVPLEHSHRAARQVVVELAVGARVVLVVALHPAARLRVQRAQPAFQRASELRPPADAGRTCPSKTTSLQLPSPLGQGRSRKYLVLGQGR